MVFSLLSSLVRFTITRTAYEYELRGTDGNRDAGCMGVEWKDTEWKDIEWKDTEWKDTEWKDSAGPWLAHRSRYERDECARSCGNALQSWFTKATLQQSLLETHRHLIGRGKKVEDSGPLLQ